VNPVSSKRNTCISFSDETEAPLLLLIFNNPDCSLCHRTEEEIEGDSTIQRMIRQGRMRVLAITPDADFEEWERHHYPHNWMVGFDREKAIYGQRLYDIQRLPCMYLLDKDKRVLLKEANYERLRKFIEKKHQQVRFSYQKFGKLE
jgi:thioredoxin-related protein